MTSKSDERLIAITQLNTWPWRRVEIINDEFIITPRAMLPEMRAGGDRNYLIVAGQEFPVPDCNPEGLRQVAHGLLVYADQIEGE